MPTIQERTLRDGSRRFTAQIVIKKEGVTHREAKSFERRAMAVVWAAKREEELKAPGALERLNAVDPPLVEVIDRYITESRKEIGKTKAQVLATLKKTELAQRPCGKITSVDLVEFVQGLSCQPQTAGNYLSHLSAIYAVAKPAWGYPLDHQTIKDAFTVTRRLGLTSKSKKRDRRPTLEQLDRIMTHFALRTRRRAGNSPMHKIVAFALFSTRRLSEILRIRWEDLEAEHSRILVRDLKDPGEKIGNHVWCDLPEEALRIIESMPRVEERIFPYNEDAVGMAFTRAMKLLGIEDIHFHDLRHEGVSRLFEMGWTIPKAASVSGHKSWQSLQRYAHLRHTGDKFKDWKWLDIIAPRLPSPASSSAQSPALPTSTTLIPS